MDSYATKIKLSAENLIRVDFPEKALELDTLVSVENRFDHVKILFKLCPFFSNFVFRVQFYRSVK